MGKIYGVHSSYCAIVTPDPCREGPVQCTCQASPDNLVEEASHPPKDDQGKAKIYQFFMQQFPLGMIELARHMEKGCSDPGHVFLGWQSIENGFQRYSDAMLRHLLEEIIATVTDIDREEVDKLLVEKTQAVATAANAMIRLELLLRKHRNLNLDERPRA